VRGDAAHKRNGIEVGGDYELLSGSETQAYVDGDFGETIEAGGVFGAIGFRHVFYLAIQRRRDALRRWKVLREEKEELLLEWDNDQAGNLLEVAALESSTNPKRADSMVADGWR
jgi:hypothetical protein